MLGLGLGQTELAGGAETAMLGTEDPPAALATADATALVHALAAAGGDDDPTTGRTGRLRHRRFELLPLTGPGAAFTDVQGRGPGATTTPADLAELITSIAAVGVLEPILVEELPDGDRRVVAGERRLRAARWGAANLPDNPHFAAIPAVVCPGPLSEEDRRIWQLVENLVRDDLQPGELAAALLYERCALLTSRLLAAGIPVPRELVTIDDPVARFRALDRLRLQAGQTQLGAPWKDVLRRLGIQLSPRRVADMVHAFATLPPEMSAEMDQSGVALATRMHYLTLDRGRRDAAAGLWAAVRASNRPDLLAAAVREQLDHPQLPPQAAVRAAAAFHAAADAARRDAQRQRPQPGQRLRGLDERIVRAALAALRELLRALRDGAQPTAYDAGSLRLFAHELLGLLGDDGEGGEP